MLKGRYKRGFLEKGQLFEATVLFFIMQSSPKVSAFKALQIWNIVFGAVDTQLDSLIQRFNL